LPGWAAADFGLAAGTTVAALDEGVWKAGGANAFSDRQRNFLLNLVQGRRAEIAGLKAFTQPIPYWLDLRELAFSTRTTNCLTQAGLLASSEKASALTFADLFAVRSMGVVSILEFICVVESAVDRASAPEHASGMVASTEELAALAKESWADQVGAGDPRFSDLIPPAPQATVLEMLEAAATDPDYDQGIIEALAQIMGEVRARLSAIEAMTLESALMEFARLVSRLEGERFDALLKRLGWHGEPPVTLEEAGDILGVTRERIRQLQERMNDRLSAIPFQVYMPKLDAALEALREAAPLSADAAASLLRERGLSGRDFHPESLLAAAKALGRTPSLNLHHSKGRVTVAPAEFEYASTIVRLAQRQAQSSGASNVGELVVELASEGVAIDEARARQVLRELSSVQFLDEDWFTYLPANPDRNRLRNVTRKMLSVAAPMELGTLREGVRREYKFRGVRGVSRRSLVAPPRSVMRAFYALHPEFEVDQNDMVRPVDPLDYRSELALNETILVDALRSSPACVLDRASVANECLRRSMNVNSFNLYLTYSPVVAHLGTDIWSLRGVRVDPAAVEAVRAENALRPKERRVLDHGWTREGNLWLAARIGPQHASHVVGVPSPIRRFVTGREFSARDEDGVGHGVVRINVEGASYGFASFLRQRGADEGDILIAEFDLAGGAALLRLGDDELLDEMSPQIE